MKYGDNTQKNKAEKYKIPINSGKTINIPGLIWMSRTLPHTLCWARSRPNTTAKLLSDDLELSVTPVAKIYPITVRSVGLKDLAGGSLESRLLD